MKNLINGERVRQSQEVFVLPENYGTHIIDIMDNAGFRVPLEVSRNEK